MKDGVKSPNGYVFPTSFEGGPPQFKDTNNKRFKLLIGRSDESQKLKIQRAALCCIDSSKLISLAMYGDQTAQAYSKCDLTRTL